MGQPVLLQQVAEAQNRTLVRHHLVAQLNPRETPHRLIGGTRQNLSGLDSAGSTDVRSHFAFTDRTEALREALHKCFGSGINS